MNKLIQKNGRTSICFVTTVHQSMEWFVVDAALHLSRNGYDVTFICNMPEEFKAKYGNFAQCIHVPMDRGVTITSSMKAIWTMYQIFRQEKFSIIQYSTPNAAMYASVASWLARCPIRLYAQWGLRYEGFKGFKRVVFRSLERITCILSTHVRAQSPKNRLLGISDGLYPTRKVQVIGLGGTIGVSMETYDIERKSVFRQEIRNRHGLEEQYVFGYVGRINADKGINELTEAFRRIVNEGGTQRLMLVGMPDDVNPITPENLEWLHTCPQVIMTGNVIREEVPMYMSAFDVLVHPTYREGFGKVLQEAMAMQLPIITTDVPGPSEVVEEGISGLLVPARNSDALYQKMLQLNANQTLANSLAAAARRRVETYFTRDKMVANILDDMNKITHG